MRPIMPTYGLLRSANLRAKAVNELADFKGVKIRTIQADIPLRTFQLLGANPVPMASTQVYTALQTGVLDAWEAPVDAMVALKMNEVAKFVSLTGHQYVNVVLVMNNDFFQKAPKDVQALFVSTAKSLLAEHRKLMSEAEQQALKTLQTGGVQINEIANKKPFQDAVSPIYEDVGKKYGYFDLITQVRSMQ
jgi:TRAP-type C4-dicarboxylate transport system substrate-binding protein